MRDQQGELSVAAQRGRLLARPAGTPPAAAEVVTGVQPLGLADERDGMLYVPETYNPARPAPLVLCLHGATGSGERALRHLREFADKLGIILVAPDARQYTWDIIVTVSRHTGRGYGPDVAFIEESLTRVFERFAIDPARVAIEGFSDGASYALSLGLANGDLFSHIMAFSPGFSAEPGREGSPRIFISHGTQDQVLPINMCSRIYAPSLQYAGYDVTYREFDGPHTVPEDIAAEAVRWFLAPVPR